MNNGWTPERRARQAKLIQQWQPWKKSSGPTTKAGKEVVGKNAYKGGDWKTIREISRVLREQKRFLAR